MGPINSLIATDEEDLLAHADAVIREEIFPHLTELQEDYCVVKERIAIVSGQNNYAIPARAFNGTVRHVSWETASGSVPVDLDWVDFSRRDRYTSQGYPTHFWFENDELVINGAAPSGNLILAYAFQPNALVLPANYRIVQALGPGANEITLTQAVPTSWAAGDDFDIIDANRSGMPRYWDKNSTVVAGTQITFDSEIAGTEFGKKAVQVGDYVALAGYAGRPMVPESLHGVIAQGMCARAAEATTDVEAFQIAMAKFSQNRKDSLQLLDKRARQKKVVINYNSRFRRGRIFRRRFL